MKLDRGSGSLSTKPTLISMVLHRTRGALRGLRLHVVFHRGHLSLQSRQRTLQALAAMLRKKCDF